MRRIAVSAPINPRIDCIHWNQCDYWAEPNKSNNSAQLFIVRMRASAESIIISFILSTINPCHTTFKNLLPPLALHVVQPARARTHTRRH